MVWAEERRKHGCPLQIVGTDEHGEADVFDFDLTGPTLLLVGNETKGLSTAWRDACDHIVRIPMTGTASSLNAANAATAVLYEAARQRITLKRLWAAISPRSWPRCTIQIDGYGAWLSSR
jgi:23S rRNA (uridine2479-2'-O)-methyltransferase